MEEYVIVKSYDNKIVRVKKEEVEKYLLNQKKIKKYIQEGKSLKEIKDLLK